MTPFSVRDPAGLDTVVSLRPGSASPRRHPGRSPNLVPARAALNASANGPACTRGRDELNPTQ